MYEMKNIPMNMKVKIIDKAIMMGLRKKRYFIFIS